MSNDKTQFAWHIHSYLNGNIKFGDTKATLIAGLAGPLFFGLVRFSDWKCAFNFESCFGFLAMSSFACSFCYAFAAIWPNLFTLNTIRADSIPTSIESSGNEAPDKGFIYWGNICAHTNANTFTSELSGLSEEARIQHLGGHCFELATIADRKYRLITNASRWFAAGVVAMVVFAAVHAGSAFDNSNKKTDTTQGQTMISSQSNDSAFTARPQSAN